jgi:hypothetical protein
MSFHLCISAGVTHGVMQSYPMLLLFGQAAIASNPDITVEFALAATGNA